MPSVREGIFAAIAAALGGAGKPAGLRITRAWARSLDSQDPKALPVLVVGPAPKDDYAERTDLEEFGGAFLHRLLVRVDARARVAPDAIPDQVLDPYINWAVQALRADQTLGGLSVDITPVGTGWGLADNAELVIAAGWTDFEVEFGTADTDLTVSA